VARVYGSLALILADRKDGAGAEQALREALRIRTKAFGENHRDTAASRIALGLNLMDRRMKEAEARAFLQAGIDVLAREAGEEDARVKKARAALAGS
jgi:hypothetical protein